MKNARNLEIVERERERESRSLKTTAVLACKKGEISLQTGKQYIDILRIKSWYVLKTQENCVLRHVNFFIV